MARIVPHFLRKRLHFLVRILFCVDVREKSAVRKKNVFKWIIQKKKTDSFRYRSKRQ